MRHRDDCACRRCTRRDRKGLTDAEWRAKHLAHGDAVESPWPHRPASVLWRCPCGAAHVGAQAEAPA